jgi:uncharacterized protein YyaL (SSP411 family)
MYDQLGGGFARYSVDATWTVPHFEKMLYDNAQLLSIYAHLYRLTGDEQALRITTETAEFLIREMLTSEGGFAAALDAGVALAQRLVGEGRITAAALHLAGETRIVGTGLGRVDAGREGEEIPRLGGGDPS